MNDTNCETQAPDALIDSTRAADSVVSSASKPESKLMTDDSTDSVAQSPVLHEAANAADVTSQEAQPAGEWQPPVILEHPEGDAIRRQVEFYFSDENLPHDSHMLGQTGGVENRPVSVKHILGFARMRKYKPKTAVVESLKKSTFLDVIDGKFLKRKVPLSVQPVVKAQTAEEAEKEKEDRMTFVQKQAADKPWMTKAMLKATGFEEYYTDPPITPAVFATERELYDSAISFTSRIETAVYRYATKRKFHQRTKSIFDAFMKYGGIDVAPKQFSGGISAEELEEKDASEIAALMAFHKISEDVIMNEDMWEVDFEGVAKGFLSSRLVLVSHLLYADQKEIMATTGILRNFYNYILHHDVCPEYTEQINAARRVCSLADRELLDTIYMSRQLPGPFNSAVSRLHGGMFAAVFGEGQTWDGAEDLGGPVQQSKDILMAAILAHGDDNQYAKATSAPQFDMVYEEDVIFEVVGCELGAADHEISVLYKKSRSDRPFLETVGKLYCRRWSYPLARRSRKLHVKEGYESHRPEQDFTLFMEDHLLDHVFVGMKIEGIVMGSDLGILWLDRVDAVVPSFFQMLPNEFRDEQKAAKREAADNFDGDNEDDEQAEGHEQE